MFVACGIWCLADVWSVSPSSEQSLLHIPQATNIPYQPLLIKPIFSVLAHAEKQFFFKSSLQEFILGSTSVELSDSICRKQRLRIDSGSNVDLRMWRAKFNEFWKYIWSSTFDWALLNSETTKQGYFYTPDNSFQRNKKKFTIIFFQLAKQDICTTGFCIQLSIYINIESLSDTEYWVPVSGETDSLLVGVILFKIFYSNHQLGPKRILSFSSVIKQCDKVPNHPKIHKAFLAELFNDVPELSDFDLLECLLLAPKSYACIIRAFLCINENIPVLIQG